HLHRLGVRGIQHTPAIHLLVETGGVQAMFLCGTFIARNTPLQSVSQPRIAPSK
ncbi:unnamed protein product, partial [Ectocarpus sp. 13 AM-2016]